MKILLALGDCVQNKFRDMKEIRLSSREGREVLFREDSGHKVC